jgi:2-(1,2-epoxy-1,2-dihydrophenyl)acetyl-CoA isomerase
MIKGEHMSEAKVIIETHENTAIIKLNYPRKYNAIDSQLAAELAEFTTAVRYDSSIRAVVLTGAGDNFCSGGDLQQLQSLTMDEGKAMLASIHTFILNLVEMEKPVVAAINGAAAGLGFSLALACDLLVAGENAKFSQGFVKIGLAPDGGATWILPRLIGLYKAKQLFFTGDMIDAAQAYSLGLLAKVVSDEEVFSTALAQAKKLGGSATAAIGLTKRLLNQGTNRDFNSLLVLENEVQQQLMQTDDFKEGTSAFFEKRKPNFQGK